MKEQSEQVYRVQARRDGAYWAIWIPQVARATMARSEVEIEPMARDVISLMEEVPPESIGLDVEKVTENPNS